MINISAWCQQVSLLPPFRYTMTRKYCSEDSGISAQGLATHYFQVLRNYSMGLAQPFPTRVPPEVAGGSLSCGYLTSYLMVPA